MFRWTELARQRAPVLTPRARLCVEQLEERNLLSTTSFAPPYTPAQITHAYGFDQIKADGAGQTIAIVDAYYDPTIQSDLSTFSSQFGLAQLNGQNGNGTFTQVDLSNKTLSPAGDDWTIETALDVEWAHVIAPKANILLVEAASDRAGPDNAPDALLHAVDVARGAVLGVTDVNGNPVNTAGVSVLSMSWGVPEGSIETNFDFHMQTPTGHQGITFVAATGDSGAPATWPAVSPYVVAAGGTTLNLNPTTGAWSSETGWGNGRLSWYYGGSGGGISNYELKPSYQSSVTQSSKFRTTPDLSFDANPNTGYYVYDAAQGGWFGYVGGTSEASPQLAAMVELADQLRGQAGQGTLDGYSQTLPAIYAAPAGDFHDIIKGNNGYAAGKGYDLVTGRGSPIANLLVPFLANWSGTSGSATPASSGTQTTGTSTAGTGAHTHRADVVSAPNGLAGLVTETLSTASVNQQFAPPAAAANPSTTADPTSVQVSLRLSSVSPQAPVLLTLTPVATTAASNAAAFTGVPVAAASNSGGSLRSDDRLDQDAERTDPPPMAPTPNPAPPAGDRDTGDRTEDETVRLFPLAVDAVFTEGYAPTAVEMQESYPLTPLEVPSNMPTSQEPALAVGLTVLLALGWNSHLRNTSERRHHLRV